MLATVRRTLRAYSDALRREVRPAADLGRELRLRAGVVVVELQVIGRVEPRPRSRSRSADLDAPVVAGAPRAVGLHRMHADRRQVAGIDQALERAHPAHLAHRVARPAQVVGQHPALGRRDVARAAEHVPGQREVARVAEMGERLGDARRPLRDQELVGVDEGHPAEAAAEVRGGVGIGEHLVVDLAPEPGVGEDLPPGHDDRAPPRAASSRRIVDRRRRCCRCRRSGSGRTPARRWKAAHSRMCRASFLTISAIATPVAIRLAARGGTMPILLILPRAGSFQSMPAI